MLPYLLKAKRDNLNEADTCLRISEILENVLEYNPLEDISREAQIKEGRADFAIKVDATVRFLVEAKAAGVSLSGRHVGQAERYAAEGNIPWVLVTNCVAWNLYHLSFDDGIEYETAFALDLSVDDFDKCSELLALLHKKSVEKKEHEDFWKQRAALSPQSIAKALFSEDTLRRIRREIRKGGGVLIDYEDLGRAIHEMLSEESREKIGPLKIRRRRRPRKKGESAAPQAVIPDAPTPATGKKSAAGKPPG